MVRKGQFKTLYKQILEECPTSIVRTSRQEYKPILKITKNNLALLNERVTLSLVDNTGAIYTYNDTDHMGDIEQKQKIKYIKKSSRMCHKTYSALNICMYYL